MYDITAEMGMVIRRRYPIRVLWASSVLLLSSVSRNYLY
jgi:hypothetical protein